MYALGLSCHPGPLWTLLGTPVIWLLATGAWPKGVVAHVNGDGHDNRWSNLQHVMSRKSRWQEAA